MTIRFLALFLFASVISFPGLARSFDGPLQVRNQFPIFVPINPPYLESAAVQDSASVGLSHSSVFVIEQKKDWTVNMDLELTELDIRLKKKLGERSEIGLDVPFLRPSEGFLDRPLADLHDFLGTGDYGRHTRPYNSFLYEVLYQGSPVIRVENDKSGMGDVRLTFKRVLSDGAAPVSVLADVELPAGDAKEGYGNGSVDAAVALLADLALGRKYRGYANIGVVFPGDLKAYQTIPLRTFAYAGFGVEAAWWERFSIIVQTLIQSSPYPTTGIRQVDWPGILLVMGGRYSFDRSSLEFSLTEDPDTAGAPDFIVNVTYKMKF